MQVPIKTNHPLNAMLLAHADNERVNKSGGVYHAPAGKEDHPVNVLNMMPPTAIFTPLVAPGNGFIISGAPTPTAIFKPFTSGGTAPASTSNKSSIRSAVANLFASRGVNRG